MEFCDQVKVMASSDLVIAQHGAALSLAAYLPPGSAIIELQPILNSIFAQIAYGFELLYFPTKYKGVGFVERDLGLSYDDFGDIFLSKQRDPHVLVSPMKLIKLVDYAMGQMATL
jgi:hypothetical protein